MKKISILFAALAITAMTAQADVLLVEDFDYEVGSTLLQANDEWFHYWTGHENTMIITDGGLEFAGYAGSGIGNALLVEGDHTSDEPYHKFQQIKEPGDIYAAFLLQPTEVIKNGYLLTFCDENVGNFNNCGRVFLDYDYFEEDESYHPIIGSRVFKETPTYAEDLPLDETKTYLVVLRYEVIADAKNEVSLYLFDEMPKQMPSTPLIGPLTNSQAPDIYPAHVGLHTWNGSYGDSGEVLFDGLRIATTFWEALGVDEPMDISSQQSGVNSRRLVLRDGQIIVTDGVNEYSLLGQKK